MRLTIIRDDNIVGIDGMFKNIDLAGLISDGIRAVQWDGTSGEIEFYSPVTPNLAIDNIDQFSNIVAIYNLPPQDPVIEEPTAAELIAVAHARINTDYEASVNQMTAGYPPNEISSWPKQELEARAWTTDELALTPWLDAAAVERGIPKSVLVTKVIENANAFAPLHGYLTGKRQKLRDQIEALGAEPTEAQLNAIQW